MIFEHRWVADTDSYIAICCPHCGGEMEALKREPRRKYWPNIYVNRILLCTRAGCRRFIQTELCMCLVQEHDESFVLVWRPCPPNLCERPDHNHAGTCLTCGRRP